MKKDLKKQVSDSNLYSKKIPKNQMGISNYNHELLKNTYKERFSVFIGTPCTGVVRMEWAMARFGAIIPCNFGCKTAISWMPNYAPMGYLVADAQNLIVKRFIEDGTCDWLFLVEEDNIIPPDIFIRLNEYMRSGEVPIISGLYFTKSMPAEPMVYRGRGTSFYTDWKVGDKVWVDAIPTGCILIHRKILEVLWNESPEYRTGDQIARRVFLTPETTWTSDKGVNNSVGTSDMEFCSRCIMTNVFEKAGFPKIAKMQYPFLIDTAIKVGHITPGGQIFPHPKEWEYWHTNPKDRPSLITGNGANIKRKRGKTK